jgi:hypothetical protein
VQLLLSWHGQAIRTLLAITQTTAGDDFKREIILFVELLDQFLAA